MKKIISTDRAPAAIGTYSQAVAVASGGSTVYLSGQLPLDPTTMTLVDGVDQQIHQVFKNLTALTEAAGGSLADIVKLTIYLTDLSHFAQVNQIMSEYMQEPYPARAAIGIAELPKGAVVEIEGVMVLGSA